MTGISMVPVMLALCSLGPAISLRHPVVVPETVKTGELLALDEPAPEWKLIDDQGQTHSLSDYRGRVVVLDFWATWCKPCAEIMPQMQKLHEKFKGQAVVVFGVNSWENSDSSALMKKKNYTYPMLLRGEEITERYKIKSLPVVYIIGMDGRIVYRHAGPDNKSLAKLLEKYLKEHAV